MFEEYKYKTELHAHTKPASVCSEIPPQRIVEVYKEMGYTSIAITNHFTYSQYSCPNDKNELCDKINAYLDDYYKTVDFGKKSGLNVILGTEIRFSENYNDYLIYGINPDDFYEISSLLGDGIENFYKSYKNDKNIIIQAHPFRDGISTANPDAIDGVEVFNVHPGHNSRIGYAAQFAQKHNKIITCGTDYHHPGHEGLCGILTKEPLTNSYQLAEVLTKKDFIIDMSGYKILP